jgi:hypothetical protein
VVVRYLLLCLLLSLTGVARGQNPTLWQRMVIPIQEGYSKPALSNWSATLKRLDSVLAGEFDRAQLSTTLYSTPKLIDFATAADWATTGGRGQITAEQLFLYVRAGARIPVTEIVGLPKDDIWRQGLQLIGFMRRYIFEPALKIPAIANCGAVSGLAEPGRRDLDFLTACGGEIFSIGLFDGK